MMDSLWFAGIAVLLLAFVGGLTSTRSRVRLRRRL
jgi:hypothetical protein